MQDDGNLVIYHSPSPADTKAIWSSRTSGPTGEYFLALNDEGNLGVFPGVRFV